MSLRKQGNYQRNRNPNPTSTLQHSQTPPRNVKVKIRSSLYVIGVPPSICDIKTLQGKAYFGMYGTVTNVIINRKGNPYRRENEPLTYAVHITYENEIQSSLALASLFELREQEMTLRSCYGYNRYCESFVSGKKCPIKKCIYLHERHQEQEIPEYETMRDNHFERQLETAAAILYKNRREIIEKETRKRDVGEEESLFPSVAEGMKILVDEGYQTVQQYFKEWEDYEDLKCETESTVSDPNKEPSEEEVPEKCDSAVSLEQMRGNKCSAVTLQQMRACNKYCLQDDQSICHNILRILKKRQFRAQSIFEFAWSPTSSNSALLKEVMYRQFLFTS